MTYAALTGTLAEYAAGTAVRDRPGAPDADAHARRASRPARARLADRLAATGAYECEIVDGRSTIGGGTTPGLTLPTRLLALTHRALSADSLDSALRGLDPPDHRAHRQRPRRPRPAHGVRGRRRGGGGGACTDPLPLPPRRHAVLEGNQARLRGRLHTATTSSATRTRRTSARRIPLPRTRHGRCRARCGCRPRSSAFRDAIRACRAGGGLDLPPQLHERLECLGHGGHADSDAPSSGLSAEAGATFSPVSAV